MKGSKALKTAAALVILGYCSLLVYQGGSTFNFQETRAAVPQVQVPQFSIEPVTKTSIDDSGQNKNLTLDDIFISVKTTSTYQQSRLSVILKTWFQIAKEQTWFFTDAESVYLQQLTNGHMVNTNCPSTHERKHLCCKMSVEYDHYLESSKKWFCHFDDDNYVNVPRLVSVLDKYNHQDDWYLGRPSVSKPLTIKNKYTWEMMYKFYFATGGAGFCISRSLALKMVPVASGGKFMTVCENIQLPDDVTMGFIIELILKRNLTVVPEFHSHLEQLKLLPTEKFKDQISFSFSTNKSNRKWNVLNVPGFDTYYDPTRFLSLHCFLFPDFDFCPR